MSELAQEYLGRSHDVSSVGPARASGIDGNFSRAPCMKHFVGFRNVLGISEIVGAPGARALGEPGGIKPAKQYAPAQILSAAARRLPDRR
jgi:hypothetical protein